MAQEPPVPPEDETPEGELPEGERPDSGGEGDSAGASSPVSWNSRSRADQPEPEPDEWADDRRKTKGFDQEKGFLEHLEDLRWHLVRSLVAVLVFMVILFANISKLIEHVILWPIQEDFPMRALVCRLSPEFCRGQLDLLLQATDPSEQFTRAILVSIVGGFILAFPYIAWEFWRFLKPGLYRHEVQNTRGLVGTVSLLFLVGVCFGYFIVLPFTLGFFASFKLAADVENIWRIGKVINLVVQISLAGGILFEMPVISYFLSKLGLLTPRIMRKFRRHAVVATLITAGILTPGPDLMSQILLAVPMLLLYELSILISARVKRKRQRDYEAREARLQAEEDAEQADEEQE